MEEQGAGRPERRERGERGDGRSAASGQGRKRREHRKDFAPAVLGSQQAGGRGDAVWLTAKIVPG